MALSHWANKPCPSWTRHPRKGHSRLPSWSSSYNPHFKHHENFSYANQKAAVQFPPGFNPGAKLLNNEGRPSQDDAMEAMFKKMEEFMKGTSSQIKTLEHQMG
ncbi:hypothetical protein ACS0TY_006922 [Phlomoides rotata]